MIDWQQVKTTLLTVFVFTLIYISFKGLTLDVIVTYITFNLLIGIFLLYTHLKLKNDEKENQKTLKTTQKQSTKD